MAQPDHPVTHLLLGYKDGEKWLAYARSKLEQLYIRSQAMGGIYLTRQLRTADAQIHLRVHGNQRWIRIEALQCPVLFSGLAEPLWPDHRVVVTESDGSQTVKLNHFHPKGFQFIQSEDLNNVTEALLLTRPGQFSGEMRKVVQDHLGRNLIPPYNFRFSTTHGIYTAADKSKWVIEISASGVFAWKLKICIGQAREKLNGLDYVPLPSPRPEEPLVLATAEDVQEPYLRGIFFSAQGWAFSANGSKAANTTIEFLPDNAFMFVRLWTIAIADDGEKPTKATLTKGEGGHLWSPKISGLSAKMKVPEYDSAPHFPVVVDFDTNYGISSSGIVATGTPIYVWYEGESLQVVRFHRQDNISSGVAYTDPWPVPHVGGPGSPPPESVVGRYFGPGTIITHITCFESPVLGKHTNIDEVLVKDGTRSITYKTGDAIGEVVLQEIEYEGVNRDVNSNDMLIIPVNDREAVFHIRQIITNASWNLFQHLNLVGSERQLNGSIIADPCRAGGCANPPQQYVAFFEPAYTFDRYMVGTFTTQTEWNGMTDVDKPPGWCQLLGCDGMDWWFRPDDPTFIQLQPFAFNGNDPEKRENSGGAWIDGKKVTVDLDAASMGAWLRNITSGVEERPQLIMAVADMTEAITPIYTKTPFPDTQPLGSTLTGGTPYPANELQRGTVAFVGNP